MSAVIEGPEPGKQSMMIAIGEAIKSIHEFEEGASRAAIAKYLIANCGYKAGGLFNANLRLTLKKGIECGALQQGSTAQRYKFGDGKPNVQKPKIVKKKRKVVKKGKAAVITKAKFVKLKKENVVLQKQNKALEKELKGLLTATQKAVKKVIKKKRSTNKKAIKKM